MTKKLYVFVLLVLVLDNMSAFAQTIQTNPDSIPFAPAGNYSVGHIPRIVFCADLDNDGDLDIAVTNEYSDNLSILMNNGDGTFQPATYYYCSSRPMGIFCADLNRDSYLDLAVANWNSDYVSILLNKGDGTFYSPVHYDAGYGPTGIFCADLDGDLDLDLAVTNAHSAKVSILKNEGNGTFLNRTEYNVGISPYYCYCADLDGDLDLDLTVANVDDDNISVLLNRGDGTFQTGVNYQTGEGSVSVFCADLDGDLDQDMVVSNCWGDSVTVLLNNGDGEFSVVVNYPTGDGPHNPFCADLDEDSDLDIVLANHYTNTISILKNNGDGTFRAKVDYIVGSNPYSVFCADLDGDGDYDLAVTNSGSDSVSILKNLTQESGWEHWDVSWSYPTANPFLISVPYDYNLLAHNIGDNWQTFDYGLSYFVRPLNWLGNEMYPPWYLGETALCSVNNNPYILGQPMSDVIGPSEARWYLFRISHHWNWIRPWDVGKIANDALKCIKPALEQELQNYVQLHSWVNLGMRLADFLVSIPQLEITYQGMGDANTGPSPPFYYWVSIDKIGFYWGSLLYALDGGKCTAAGFACLWNPWLAAGLFVAEAGCFAMAHEGYMAAVDPDSNFTQLASPRTINEPAIDTMSPGQGRTIAELTFQLLSINEAMTTSYVRYLGALQADSGRWATIQLASTKLYMQLQVPLAEQLSALSDSVVDSIPIPSPEEIAAIRDSLRQNGLPDIEVNVLQNLGFTNEEIESLTAVFISADDEVYTSFPELSANVSHICSTYQALLSDFSEPPNGAKLGDLGTDPDTLEMNAPPPILNCWVEFPNDSDLTGYQIISAVLNDTIQASYISPTPGDYDHDGIPDIAMQFNTALLVPLLQPGPRLLSVSGDIILPSADTVLYSGSAILTVLAFVRGDANSDGVINASDVVYLINYLFISGPAPVPLQAGDCNCDGNVNASDVVYLINYLFISGPPPCR
jgi:ankyrin repeat protein